MNNHLHDDVGSEIYANGSLTHDDDVGFVSLSDSNGSVFSSASMFIGSLGAATDLVEEPIGRSGGVLFNHEVEILCEDGTIRKIPLNTDGFYPSRQYESDPLDFCDSEDFSISLGGDSNTDLFAQAAKQNEDEGGGEEDDADDDDIIGDGDGYNNDRDGPTQEQQSNNLNQQTTPNGHLHVGLGSHVTGNAARAAK